jgi:FMN phosphatase YigB (HAD superfamily)
MTCVCETPPAQLRRVLGSARLFLVDLDDTLLNLKREEARALQAAAAELSRRYGVDADEFTAAYRAAVRADRTSQKSGAYSWEEARYIRRAEHVMRSLRTGSLRERLWAADLHELLLSLRLEMVEPVPYAEALLRALSVRALDVVVLTHGTTRVQQARLEAAGLLSGIRQLITSEDMGCSKSALSRWWDRIGDRWATSPDRAVFLSDRDQPDLAAAGAFGVPGLLCRPAVPGHENDLAVVLGALAATSSPARREPMAPTTGGAQPC